MDKIQLKEQVNQYIDDNAEQMVDILGDLVVQKTVTGNELPAQEVVIEKFKSMGLTPEVWCPDAEELRDHQAFFETQPFQEHGYEDRPNVNATIEGSGDGPSLVLSGHVDVVPVTESEWEHDPWTMEREGDRVYGRGTGDMKGGGNRGLRPRG